MRREIRRIFAMLLLLAVCEMWEVKEFYHYQALKESVDAQVEQYLSPVNLRASGYIKKICFQEHQNVKKGVGCRTWDRIRVSYLFLCWKSVLIHDSHGSEGT